MKEEDFTYRRESVGRLRSATVADVHPLPWIIREHRNRGGHIEHIVLDVGSRRITEFESRLVAEAFVHNASILAAFPGPVPR